MLLRMQRNSISEDAAAVKVDLVVSQGAPAGLPVGQVDQLAVGQSGQVVAHQVSVGDDDDYLHSAGLPPAQSAGVAQLADTGLYNVLSVGTDGVADQVGEFDEPKERRKKGDRLKKKARNSSQFSDADLKESNTSEKEIMEISPSVKGIKAWSGSDSQATSKAGLSPDSQIDLSINSQATSKAGIFQTWTSASGHISDADDDMNDSESCELQKIIPSSSLESSYDSSPRLHKQASGQLESTGLPNNTRSIQNRDMKANIVVKKDCGEN